ncbi:MAG: ATP-grasp domain-containing protein [Candidatus Nanoarchaeia archaeon]|nr:ATP-grasp domain-containing protein [Candidatus Nanoarchaeia archaeon]MDD5357723.1 ATP-grasp domain-containing protein [Candidatus Nanoarchaeia archaeon]MDD5588642.1 ATP-grasp domain-containing protein [Candidatus Nanoarchaeia archaeon]
MKKISIGYIFNEIHPKKEDRLFREVAKEKGINLIMINTNKYLTEEDIEEDVKKCDLFFNNSTEDISMELTKTIEELGDKVIEPSNKFYYFEDKWMFFMKCFKHKIPTLKTILLSENIPVAKKELIGFNHWPVILKRIQGNNGEYVAMAKNTKEAEQIMKRFWKKGSERLAIIAQEFVSSLSYRVTVVGDKIVQTAIRPGKGWKKTGNHSNHIGKFKVDKELEKTIKKTIKVFGISVCGIDFLKKDGKWLVLEINAQPGLDFFINDRKRLVGEILDFLKKKAR